MASEQLSDQPPPFDPTKCQQCGAPPQAGYEYPLCPICRQRLIRAPLPPWLIASAIGVLALMGFALTLSPSTWAGAIAFERGKRAESEQRFADAEEQYLKALARFDDSTKILERVAVTAFGAKDYATAAEAVSKLGGRNATSDATLQEVSDVIEGLNREAEKIDKAEKAAKQK